MSANAPVPIEQIQRAIVLIRGQRVMLDQHLAELYGVATRILVRNVKRNLDRFPADFMMQLSAEEWEPLRSHFGISKSRGGRRYLPYAFTEHGIAMLSSVLHSRRAVQVNIEIVRTFVRLRAMVATNRVLARRLDELERKTDSRFRVVFQILDERLLPKERTAPRRIGFSPAKPAKPE